MREGERVGVAVGEEGDGKFVGDRVHLIHPEGEHVDIGIPHAVPVGGATCDGDIDGVGADPDGYLNALRPGADQREAGIAGVVKDCAAAGGAEGAVAIALLHLAHGLG